MQTTSQLLGTDQHQPVDHLVYGRCSRSASKVGRRPCKRWLSRVRTAQAVPQGSEDLNGGAPRNGEGRLSRNALTEQGTAVAWAEGEWL